MPKNGMMKVVAGVGAAGVIAVSGAALASSQAGGASATPSTGTSQQGAQGQPGGQGMRGGHQHTEVTGTALTNVKSAVKAKDAAVSIEKVLQDPDGSYDVLGTKSGAKVMVEVSKDLKTIDVRTGGPGGHRGPGGHGDHKRGTEVTGTALTNVKNAVKAKDSAVTVEKAFKETDGTYHAMGTKAGQRVMVDVSQDLKTVTVKTGMPGDGHGPRGDHGPGDGKGASQQGSSSGSQSSTPQGSTSSSSNSSTQTSSSDGGSQAA